MEETCGKNSERENIKKKKIKKKVEEIKKIEKERKIRLYFVESDNKKDKECSRGKKGRSESK